jgi:hypothetical protein
MGGSVTVDTRDLERGVRQLTKGLAQGGPAGAATAARQCAAAIRARTPVRTGRLQASVSAVMVGHDTWGVAYGGGLRYARPVAARTRNVAAGIAGHPARFQADMRALASHEVNRL